MYLDCLGFMRVGSISINNKINYANTMWVKNESSYPSTCICQYDFLLMHYITEKSFIFHFFNFWYSNEILFHFVYRKVISVYMSLPISEKCC